jgi:endonuclease-3
MTLLSAQDSDRNINLVAPKFFQVFPTLSSLSTVQPEDIYPTLKSVRHFANKAAWLCEIAKTLKSDDAIPHGMKELTALKGIGRKSASVIIRESGGETEGIIVDLHVLRVAPRLGIAVGERADQIEKQLMAKVDKSLWGELGMAISFLGREICRPKQPKCADCPLCLYCEYRIADRNQPIEAK